jgi:hypothetical protein
MTSQNARFKGTEPAHDPNEPPGWSVVEKVRVGLEPRGWNPGETDLGVGWFVPCRRGDHELEVVVVDDTGGWFLQIVKRDTRGWWARLRDPEPFATDDDLYELAESVHQILVANGYTDIAWCWNGHPRDVGGTLAPTPASM